MAVKINMGYNLLIPSSLTININGFCTRRIKEKEMNQLPTYFIALS